jgi:hypothetical protein
MPGLSDLLSSNNLYQMTNSILTLPHNTKINPIPPNVYPEEEESKMYSNIQVKVGGKGKKIASKKKKIIDSYTKDKLVKIAKKHGIKLSLKGVKRTKEQLFNSLKRKKLI